jgi:cytochrome c5
MKSHLILWLLIVSIVAGAGMLTAQSTAANTIFSSQPTYVPDMSHQYDHLSDATLAWDATMKVTNVAANATSAHFVFYFTNVAVQVDRVLVTNITTKSYTVAAAHSNSTKGLGAPQIFRTMLVTNVTWVTNAVTPLPVVITDVHPSCGCTTAQLPPRPWTIQPGQNSQIGVTVDVAGKFGTLVKTIHVATDLGSRDLIVQINILPPTVARLTDDEIMRQMRIAKADRQAVFKNDCAACHKTPGDYKYGKNLYDAVCAICHDAQNRASMVPDLHSLKVPTNQDFWRIWISHGKPGSFMPAFSTADGGPLSDMQIASLAAYLSAAIPSRVPSLQ